MNQGRREGSENHNGRPEVCYHVCTKNLALSFLEAKREKKSKYYGLLIFLIRENISSVSEGTTLPSNQL